MNCPKCNELIPEGYLYCPKCGEEIRIVPDFEVEIEESLSLTKDAVASLVESEISGEVYLDTKGATRTIPDVKRNNPGDKDYSKTKDVSIDNAKRTHSNKTRNNNETEPELGIEKGKKIIKAIVFAGTIIAVALICVFAGIMISRYYSFNYQYNEALACYDKGNYDDAIKFAKRAVSINKSDKSACLLLSDCYFNAKKYDESIAVLEDMASIFDEMLIAEKLIADYEALAEYSEIVKLLNNLGNEDLIAKYSEYFVSDPEFSVEPGTYEDSVSVEILAGLGSSVYYTTDGSEPGIGSFMYKGPISLGEGVTVITAVAINSKGLASNSISGTYEVTYSVVEGVKLNTSPGNYIIPKLITVECEDGGTIYYTTDKTVPNENSAVYDSAIPMPLGTTEYRFVVYDENGNSSDVTVAEYSLNMEGLIDKGSAENAVQIRLMALGNLDALTNLYICRCGYGMGNNSFYLVSEFKQDGKTMTGNVYAVDTKIGTIFKAVFDKDKDDYTLTPI